MEFHSESNIYVGEVNLKVTNLERSLRFYQEVIGFQIVEQSERKAKLSANGKTVLLSIEQPENVTAKERNTTGLYHFALLLPNRSDLADIVNHFVKIGLPIGSSDHLVSEALYFSDPDGNGIEIYADRVPAQWTWKDGEVQMTVDPLDFKDLLSEAKQEWKGLPAKSVMGHIHLHVSELSDIEEFYIKGLGFEVVSHLGSQALFIATGKYHHHIGLNTWAGEGAPAPSENSAGLSWYSLVFPSKEARERVVRQLEGIGSSVHEEEEGVLLTRDPSGNRIHLLV
ncbi:catechol 2,3-dioxygenase [Peribacillus deserti]|uniref:Catechol 2,3-dioxygenase n=1 Tax=Peribacillus deserti TaxID=673318 RepID=A0ABS2QLN8_9BACI|nr:VOC family protein [Peribacillus deserti]MBM7694082.1 catechol 2,3-dioxygenase [Peribacillus deserti]